VTRCTDIAAVKVAEITELIQRALDADAAAHLSGSVAVVTSTCHAAVSANSVGVSHTEPVDMNTAKQTAVNLLGAASAHESLTSASVADSDSVPTTAVVDSGIHSFTLLVYYTHDC